MGGEGCVQDKKATKRGYSKGLCKEQERSIGVGEKSGGSHSENIS